ncbi:MAG: SDR family oxidoreductase [Actinobacteria bacterium]|nr:SDR family oxidoreductase [Actinomycetota bacterium]
MAANASRPKSLLVTGAGRGLGQRIAERAADAGYRVIAVDVSFDGSSLAQRSDVTRVSGSISDESFASSVFAAHGPVDVLVNNAGIVRFGPLLDLASDAFRAVVDVNLVGTFLMSRAAASAWRDSATPGAIVNITSMNGVAAGPNAGAYGSTKAAVALLTSQMAIEWGSLGIRVNAVAPGLIDAGMSEPIYADPATRQARESKVPLGRLGTSDDIASVVLFLASDEASYIHGQNIVVDGGVTGSVIAHLPRPASVDSVGHTSKS